MTTKIEVKAIVVGDPFSFSLNFAAVGGGASGARQAPGAAAAARASQSSLSISKGSIN